MSMAKAADGGAPADSRISASGISKNVGIASGIAINAITIVKTTAPVVELNAPVGNHSAMNIEIKTPNTMIGTVRTATRIQDFSNAVTVDCSTASASTGHAANLVLKIRSTNADVRNTLSTATIARTMPNRAPNSMKVSSNAKGLSAGAARMVASGGPTRDDRSYMLEKIGAAQQEQSINGIPAAPAMS